jgi:hypothetical protein
MQNLVSSLGAMINRNRDAIRTMIALHPDAGPHQWLSAHVSCSS